MSSAPPLPGRPPADRGLAARRWALALAAAVAGTPADRAYATQERVIDGGTLLVLREGQLVGLEEFQVRQSGRPGGPQTLTITATAHYPAERPTHVLVASVRFGGDSVVSSARFEVQGTESGALALVTVSGRRITVRIGLPGRESTREYPGTTPPTLLDDSLFAIHAVSPPIGTGGATGMLWPRAGRMRPGTVTAAGRAETTVGGVRRMLHHVTLTAGGPIRHLWFDDEGRLQKVEAPEVGVTAERRAGGR